MNRPIFLLVLLVFATGAYARAEKRYPVSAMVLSVDPEHKAFVASCKSIPGYMDAMEMPYAVHDRGLLHSLKPGAVIDFTLVVEKDDSYAEDIRIRHYENFQQEPMAAGRLSLIDRLTGVQPAHVVAVGESIPQFSLIDQNRQQVSLSQFSGKVIALTFIYTTCPLPNYCFRLSNNFGRLNSRFRERMEKDLVLLSVTFDPVHDQPDVLEQYSRNWAGEKNGWHFLTGPPSEVKILCRSLGLNFWPDEGTVTHSLHTLVIDRHGKLAANFEGNEFTAQQLGDFVQTLMQQPN